MKHLLVDAKSFSSLSPLLAGGPQGQPKVHQGAQGSMQAPELSSSHFTVLLGFLN